MVILSTALQNSFMNSHRFSSDFLESSGHTIIASTNHVNFNFSAIIRHYTSRILYGTARTSTMVTGHLGFSSGF